MTDSTVDTTGENANGDVPESARHSRAADALFDAVIAVGDVCT